MFYTIIIEYDENTLVSQVEANNPDDAINVGIQIQGENKSGIFTDDEIQGLVNEIEAGNGNCVLLNGLRGVWCDTFLLNDKLVQIHAVATSQNI